MANRRKRRPGLQHSGLDDQIRDKKTLKSPLRKLQNLHFSSWVNEVLADVLWSTLIATQLEREKALATFRVILSTYKDHVAEIGEITLGHSEFAKLDAKKFDLLFWWISQDKETKEALSPLLILEKLPDRIHWQRLIGATPSPEDAWPKLAATVAETFDHQSQAATDCRWVRIMTLMAQGKMHFANEMRGRAEELIGYPNRGDMRKVRPSIRAMEMVTREFAEKDGHPPAYSEEFWAECHERTRCLPRAPDADARPVDHSALFEGASKLYEQVWRHFHQTIRTTKIDARHDGAFGLTFFILQLLVMSMKGLVGRTTVGRMVVRAALEAYLTLRFLRVKDDPTIWMQFRNYGAGQSKLAYLKTISLDDLPSSTTRELLEELANEDMWMEFQDINLGAWANKNLRAMATEAGAKDVYDKYYDSLSGYVHGNWAAVRHAVFAECMNPLHRFHRVPMPPHFMKDDAVPDLMTFSNLALDELAALYPTFKPRLHMKKLGKAPPKQASKKRKKTHTAQT